MKDRQDAAFQRVIGAAGPEVGGMAKFFNSDWTSPAKQALVVVCRAGDAPSGRLAAPKDATLWGFGQWERRDRRGAETTGGQTMASIVRKSEPRSKSASRTAGGKTSKKTKKQICIDLLARASGASLQELEKATGWQPHSVRGFLAGTVRRKLGMELTSEAIDGKPRRYHITRQKKAA